MYTRKPLESAKVYEFSLMIEALHRPIAAKGKVAWQRRLKFPDEVYEVGLVFTEISKEHREVMRDFLKDWLDVQREEQRKFLRVPRLMQARVLENSHESMFSGYVLDLSEEGIRFITALEIPDKSLVSLKMELEEGTPVSVSGLIAWGKRSEMMSHLVSGMDYVYGMKFQVSSVELQAFINAYVNHRNRSMDAALVETLLSLESGET